jgi:hypothetical protein
MSEIVKRLEEFVAYRAKLKGDEKGEAQVFCDRLFLAFGHQGYKEAGAELEHRIKSKDTKGTSFADLIWKPRLLLEMKKSKEKLFLHYQQAFDYWLNDQVVRAAYGMAKDSDPLQFLLELNLRLYADEQNGLPVIGPGVPESFGDASTITTKDCIEP